MSDLEQIVSWKDHLYKRYVSTGQARVSENTVLDIKRERAPYLDYLIRSFCPADRKARILDLGCGHGRLLYKLQKSGYHDSHGVELSSEQINIAQKLGVVNIHQGNILDIKKLNLGQFEVVFLMDVLEHLTRPEFFDLISRVTTIMGSRAKLIAHVPNAQGFFPAVVRYGDLTHEIAFTPSSMRQGLTAVGFSKIEFFEDRPIICGVKSLIRSIIWTLGSIPLRILYAAECGAFPEVFSQNMLVVAEICGKD